MLSDDQGREFMRLAVGILKTRDIPPDVDPRDVATEAAIRAHGGKPFDPRKSTFATWVGMQVGSALSNVLQHRSRQRRNPDRVWSLDVPGEREDAVAAHERAEHRRWGAVMRCARPDA